MYSNLVFVMFIMSGISTFLVIILIISFLAGTILMGIAAYSAIDNASHEDEEKEKRKWLKRGISAISIWGLILLITCMIPDKKTVLAWSVLRAVDNYNVSNDVSNLKAEKIIKTGDDIISVVNQVLKKAEELLNKE
jgi:hypothetical protein